jgi:hypothetical protein
MIPPAIRLTQDDVARTVAITPGKATSYKWEDVKRVCQTSTMEALRAIHSAGPAKPFRFVYMSGVLIARDPAKKSFFQGRYGDMRVRTDTPTSDLIFDSLGHWVSMTDHEQADTEREVLAFTAEHKDEGMEAMVVKPGFITGPGYPARNLFANVLDVLRLDRVITDKTIATAMLDQVINGFDGDPLMTPDLLRIAKRVSEASTNKD